MVDDDGSWASSNVSRATMLANRRTDTGPERRLRSELHRRGLRFRKDHPILAAGRRVRPDVVFTRRRVAVFVDGCFWHSCPLHAQTPKANSDYWVPKLAATVQRDRRNDEALKEAGWTVIRIWEHEALVDATAIVLAELAAADAVRDVEPRSQTGADRVLHLFARA
jgi:DNA mismatch endonuclease, patch repair protein